MPRHHRSDLPTLKRHRVRGRADRAFVTVEGQRIYLGSWHDPETRVRYDQFIARWLAAGRRIPVGSTTLSVVELVDRFMEHARSYYRGPDGTPTNEPDNFRIALRPVVKLFGRSPAAQFGPSGLRSVRETMVAKGWARTYVNTAIKRVRAAFRWAVSHELIPPSCLHALQAVEPLKLGRCVAPEPEPVAPVDEAVVMATLPFLPKSVQAIVRLQCIVRGCWESVA